jgi:hypothetical protein
MKIIDFEKKGNVVRFYLGEKTVDWGWTNPDYKDYTGKTPNWLKPSDKYYGDDWDDKPYEHNAGTVYGEFIKGYKDIAFDFDDLVLEPCEGEWNSPWCKDDMIARKVPCIIVVPRELTEHDWSTEFKYWVANDAVKKYYFGDELE